MTPTLIIQTDENEARALEAFLKGVVDRLAGPTGREQIQDILLKHLQPLVASERAFLAPHDKSGALSASLTARRGTGDLPGTVSVFSAPTATNAILQETWGLRGRSQQKAWAAKLKPAKTRKIVFYGRIVHQGHAAPGDKGGVNVAQPVPFASQAVESLGDEQAEAAAEEIVSLVMGGEKSSNG